MLPISALIHTHIGRPAVVIGGGPSAPEQLKQCPADAIRISTNQHGVILTQCSYIVCIDNLLTRDLEIGKGWKEPKRIRDFNVPIISTHRWADYRVFEQPAHNSAIMACWAAWLMGCAPVIPIGIDCYQGGIGNVYFHTPRAKSSGPAQLFKHHIARWVKFKADFPDVMVRPIDGPLLKTFPKYDSAEIVYPAELKSRLWEKCKGNTLNVARKFQVHGYEVLPGVQELSSTEARHAIKERAIV